MTDLSPTELASKINALGLWDQMQRFNWAIRPKGTVFPYFCVTIRDEVDGKTVYHYMMLEGWQTMQDFIRARTDISFGFYSSPTEMPHFEALIVDGKVFAVLRHDPGYVPRQINDAETDLVRRLLWETYGIAMRLESEPNLPLRYADDKAIFSRVEKKDGTWEDAPIQIIEMRPHVERVSFAKADLAKAKDLPFAEKDSLEIDFRLMPGIGTRETKSRCCYDLVIVDSADGSVVAHDRIVMAPDGGLRGLWESMPSRVLGHIIKRGRVPGNMKVVSQRTFRMLRFLGMELPFKLSLHDSLLALENAFRK